MNKITVQLTKKKDCKGSVRFDAPDKLPDGTLSPINSLYVNRSMPGINEAQAITVTIETP